MSEKYVYRPVMDRVPDEQTIRERAEFLAHEIFEDRLAPEAEIAEAIEGEIKRFARPAREIARPGGYFAVVKVRRGPLRKARNGSTCYEWAVIVLSCGHELLYDRLKNPRRRAPASALCRKDH